MALYEIRLLLAPYVGSENEGVGEVRAAAHLAYALHNEAEAMSEGKEFDVDKALRKIEAIENIVQGDWLSGFVAQYRSRSS